MEAFARSFTFLGNESIVRIPFFQRSYVWDEQNWEDLLSDLLDEGRNHFLGSVILKQQAPITGKPKEVLVIDGQQRLTTLSVLVRVIYDQLEITKQQNAKEYLNMYLFFKENPTDSDYKIKIHHSHIDKPFYYQVIKGELGQDIIENINKNSNRILQCYKYFFDTLKEKSDTEKNRIFNFLLSPQNTILVLIDLKENDDEQAIFDTINSTGVRLSSADIVKNSLFQKAFQLYGANRDEVIVLFDNTWKEVFEKDEDTKIYWDTERLVGRLKKDNLEILLHSIAVIKGFYDPDTNTMSELAKLYKNKISQINSVDDLNIFIKEITEYSKLYRQYMIVFEKSTPLSYEENITRLFHILNVLEITTFHPYILFLLKNHLGNLGILTTKMKKLEKFIIYKMISGSETKSYNKTCKQFIEDDSLLGSKIDEITKESIISGLKDVSNSGATLILFWIELYRRYKQQDRQDVTELKYTYSLEHIMPQRWEEYWKEIPEKYNTDGSQMTKEESKKDRTEKVYYLGNMTLLKSSLNTSLRNYEFIRKIQGEGRKKGMKDYAILGITRDDIITPFDRGDKIWDESKIEKRTKQLESEVFEIW